MQMNIAALKRSISSRLSEEMCANIQDEWLTECTNFFIQRDSTCEFSSLYENVKEQFLLSNFTDSANRVVDRLFASKRQGVGWDLNQNLLLQMQYLIEISEPFYEQWRRLHNVKLDDVNNDERETKTFHIKKKRTLKLELTDGHSTIYAMESTPIKCLNTKLKPGSKVLIVGPAKVMNDVVFLGPRNIKIIGGEVDDLLVVNAYENVLLKQLKRPTVQNPIKDYAEPVFDDEAAVITKPTYNYQPPQLDQKTATTAAATPVVLSQKPCIDDDDDDDIDFEMLEAIEAEALRKLNEQENSKKLKAEVKPVPIEVPSPPPVEVKKQRLEANYLDDIGFTLSQPAPKAIHKANDLLVPKMPIELSENMEVDEVVPKAKSPPIEVPVRRKAKLSDDDYEHKLEGLYNFVTIDQYIALNKREKMERTYAIEAKIAETTKCKIEGGAWVFLAKLSDSHSKNLLSVHFADELVAKISGRTAEEMNLLRHRMRSQPQLRLDLESSVAKVNSLQNKALLLTVTMKLKLPNEYENVVEQMLTRTEGIRQAISKKIKDEDISLA